MICWVLSRIYAYDNHAYANGEGSHEDEECQCKRIAKIVKWIWIACARKKEKRSINVFKRPTWPMR